LYLGLPLGAVVLARAGFRPVVAAIGHPEAPGMRRVRALGRQGTLVLARPDLSSPSVHRALASARPDAIISFFFPKKIPKSVLDLAPRGAFGAHPSLLPAYRGPDPYFWCLRNGDTETGVTLHRLDESYDTGNVIATCAVPIKPTHTAFSLARALDRPALALLVSALTRLDAGEALHGVPQADVGVSHAPTPSEADTWIDWHEDAVQIERLVRACAPFPGAAADLGDTQVEITRASVYQGSPPKALEVAEAFRTSSGGVAVRCGVGALLLREVRAADGDPLDPAALLGLDDQA
jgi:methionyl-tRNA formyltransferase